MQSWLKGFIGSLILGLMLLGLLTACGRQEARSGSTVAVEGRAPDGGAAIGYPVPIAGKDSSGNIQTLSVTADGSGVYTGTFSPAPGTTTVITGHVTQSPGQTYVITGNTRQSPGETYVMTGSVSPSPDTTTVITGNMKQSPSETFVITGNISLSPGSTITGSVSPAPGTTTVVTGDATAVLKGANGVWIDAGNFTSDGGEGTSSGLKVRSYNLLSADGGGGIWIFARAVTQHKTAVTATITGTSELVIWTPAAAKKFRLAGIQISCGNCAASDLLTVKDGAAGTVIQNFYWSSGPQLNLEYGQNGKLSATADNKLVLSHNIEANRQIAVNAWGNEE